MREGRSRARARYQKIKYHLTSNRIPLLAAGLERSSKSGDLVRDKRALGENLSAWLEHLKSPLASEKTHRLFVPLESREVAASDENLVSRPGRRWALNLAPQSRLSRAVAEALWRDWDEQCRPEAAGSAIGLFVFGGRARVHHDDGHDEGGRRQSVCITHKHCPRVSDRQSNGPQIEIESLAIALFCSANGRERPQCRGKANVALVIMF